MFYCCFKSFGSSVEEVQRDAGVSGFHFFFEVSARSSLAEASRGTARTTDGFHTNPSSTDTLSTVCFKTLTCFRGEKDEDTEICCAHLIVNVTVLLVVS